MVAPKTPSRNRRGRPALDADAVRDVAAFLRTLTDQDLVAAVPDAAQKPGDNLTRHIDARPGRSSGRM